MDANNEKNSVLTPEKMEMFKIRLAENVEKAKALESQKEEAKQETETNYRRTTKKIKKDSREYRKKIGKKFVGVIATAAILATAFLASKEIHKQPGEKGPGISSELEDDDKTPNTEGGFGPDSENLGNNQLYTSVEEYLKVYNELSEKLGEKFSSDAVIKNDAGKELFTLKDLTKKFEEYNTALKEGETNLEGDWLVSMEAHKNYIQIEVVSKVAQTYNISKEDARKIVAETTEYLKLTDEEIMEIMTDLVNGKDTLKVQGASLTDKNAKTSGDVKEVLDTSDPDGLITYKDVYKVSDEKKEEIVTPAPKPDKEQEEKVTPTVTPTSKPTPTPTVTPTPDKEQEEQEEPVTPTPTVKPGHNYPSYPTATPTPTNNKITTSSKNDGKEVIEDVHTKVQNETVLNQDIITTGTGASGETKEQNVYTETQKEPVNKDVIISSTGASGETKEQNVYTDQLSASETKDTSATDNSTINIGGKNYTPKELEDAIAKGELTQRVLIDNGINPGNLAEIYAAASEYAELETKGEDTKLEATNDSVSAAKVSQVLELNSMLVFNEDDISAQTGLSTDEVRKILAENGVELDKNGVEVEQ